MKAYMKIQIEDPSMQIEITAGSEVTNQLMVKSPATGEYFVAVVGPALLSVLEGLLDQLNDEYKLARVAACKQLELPLQPREL